ncbi:OmpA family protein, partial [Palleronia sp.]|uniref:OmpA family protein n=1 Tax=Palleronia sp. TaxID=1940284 RepID=UPI0035C7DD8C
MTHISRRGLLTGIAGLAIAGSASALPGQAPMKVTHLPYYAPQGSLVEISRGYIHSEPVGVVGRHILSTEADRLSRNLKGSGAAVFYEPGHVLAMLSETMLFKHPSDAILPDAMGWIERIAAEMLRQKRVKLDVLGHWHSDGRPSHALVQSERRAVAVQAALMSRGIPLSRIVATGLGEAYPVARN